MIGLAPVTILDRDVLHSCAARILWSFVGDGEKHIVQAGSKRIEVIGVTGLSPEADFVTEGKARESHRSYFLSTCGFVPSKLARCLGIFAPWVNCESLAGLMTSKGRHVGYSSPGYARSAPEKAKTDNLSILRGSPGWYPYPLKLKDLFPGDTIHTGDHVACVLGKTETDLFVVQFGQTGKDKSGIDGKVSRYRDFDGTRYGTTKRVIGVVRIAEAYEQSAPDVEDPAMVPEDWEPGWTFDPTWFPVGEAPATLRPGAKGPQPELGDWREVLGLPREGNLDAHAVALTRAYQARHGLIADGIVGPRTWESVR